MIEIITPLIWVGFVTYALWYFTKAKHYAPITPTEAKVLWKIHVQIAQCHSRTWKEIRHGKKIVGFECECGYKHIQKRPIVTATPTPPPSMVNTQLSIIRELHRA